MSWPRTESVANTCPVSIIIPTCNRPDLLRVCLAAVADAIAAIEMTAVEVIVTDDSADDRTQNLVARSYSWARWIRGPRRGPAANRNNGVRASHGAWLLFTDDDCIPAATWLLAYVKAMQAHPECNIFEGKTIADRQRLRLDEESPVNPTGGYLWSCNMAVRRDTFNLLGGFCETFPYAAMEDVDFRLRLHEHAEVFLFVADGVVCHPYRACKGIAFAVKTGQSYLHLVRRHPDMLGRAPWWTCALTCARRTKQVLRDAFRYRFRGIAFAVANLAVVMYFEVAARVRLTTQRP